MRSSVRSSISHRLTLILLGTSFVAVFLACMAFISFSFLSGRWATIHDLHALSRITGHNCQAALAFGIPEDAAEMLTALEEEESVVQAILLDADGRLVADYTAPGAPENSEPPSDYTDGHRFKDGYLWVTHQVEREGQTLGTLYLQDNLNDVRTNLRRDIGVFFLVLCGALLTAYLLAIRLRQPVTEPILGLASVARAVSEDHDYSVRARANKAVSSSREDEIGTLTRAFDTMLERIEAREADLRHTHNELEKAHSLLEERVRERTAELAASNRDLEGFAYVASHDLQEPLRMVSSYLQILQRRYRDQLDEEADKYIDYAVDGAHRMRSLIHDLLAYSRVATKGQEFQVVDLSEILDKALLNLQQSIDESGATVTRDRLPVVKGDPVQLTQLFQNLIGNALKYRGSEQPRIHISVTEQQNKWLLRVEDNGIGMDPEFLERVFVIFERLHTANEYAGTGIGLSLCKRIVERHGGEIRAESEGKDKGSTFIFTLPKEPNATSS